MRKLLIISGPTASGKTSLAFNLARKFNGELVSADSRQVYRGMDIVTGKEIDIKIKTWLVDVIDPDKMFNVSDYYSLAWKAIEDIWQRGKLPILVGGTGFYIKAILDGIGTMGVAPDWTLRKKLEALSVGELQKKLAKLDSKRFGSMNKSDQNNPRRLIRAIEVAGKLEVRSKKLEVNILWIGLTSTFPVLYQRIDKRVDERMRMGAVEETRELAKKYDLDMPSMTGQGYKKLQGFIEGEISLKEAVRRWKFAEHEYARKQMTWFKKEKRVIWFDIIDSHFRQKVQRRVKGCYTNS